MIIKRMILTNFFRFYDKQIIEFSTDNIKNVTIIRGENGTGKTTIINSLYWALYDDIIEPLTKEKMLNDNAAAKMNNGDKEYVSVDIQFEEKNITYNIVRKQRFIKKDDKVSKLGEVEVDITYYNENGNIKRIDDTNFFSYIIPKKLRGFFFFDGERINRLAQFEGKDEIREATLNILGLKNLETVKEDFERINGDLGKELKKYMKVDELSITENHESLLEEKQNYDLELHHKKEELKKTGENIKKVDEYLITHNSEIIKNIQNERIMLENDIKRAKSRTDELKKSIQSHISKNFKNFLIVQAFESVNKLLEEKRLKGELPSDIKVQFIDDLLDRKSCICGTLLMEGSCEYNHVKEIKKIAGRTELDDAYTKITSYIAFYTKNKDEFFIQYYSLIKEQEEKIAEKDIKEKRLKEISDQLKNFDEDKIREHENLRLKFLDDQNKLYRSISSLESKIEYCEKEIDKIQKKIKEASFATEQAKEIQKYITMVQDLGQLNNEIHSFFIKATRENLDKRIKEVFSKISRKEFRIPILADDFELKIISSIKNGEEPEILSTGEGQITSLAFIGSLISYSREKAEGGILSDFAGGDFPIVMDSPFGNLDSIHTAHVAAGIGKLAPQVIIIVSDKQWSKEVEDNIFPQVNKIYKMEDGVINDENMGEYTVVKEVAI